MLIDWFTVIAQIINFLVLVILLKRFLFDRITGVMDQREETISRALDDANNMKVTASGEAERYRKMNQALEDDRNRILGEARDAALSLRKDLIESARSEIQDLKAEWQKSLQREQESFLLELRNRIGKETVSVLRTILSDLSNGELEQSIVGVFAEKLRSAPEEKMVEIRKIFRKMKGDIIVTTAFDLNDDQKNFLTNLLTERIGGNFPIVFEREPDNICGIELLLPGHKLGWSLESYLNDFEKATLTALKIAPAPSMQQNP